VVSTAFHVFAFLQLHTLLGWVVLFDAYTAEWYIPIRMLT